MRRVVITGIGIVSSIGNSAAEVEASLRAGKSGIVFAPDYAEHGFRCRVHGQPNIVLEDHIDKRDLRFMGDGAAYTFIAMDQAVKDSGLSPTDISNDRTGIIVGSGGPSTKSFFKAHNIVRETGSPKRIGPFGVTKGMSSTVSACLATPFKIKGVNYSITSACSTSAHCIGNGTELIQMGKQDIVFAGGGEELDWTLSCLFDAMGAMSSKYNDTPERASRTYDANRDGFVIAGGGGIVVLEELEHALARGAKIYAEVTGYGATSDGHDMVAPSGEGGERAMRLALETLPEGRRVGYINAHGTSTPLGDELELGAVRRLFGDAIANVSMSSTKSAIGHLLGGAGAVETIFCILAIRDQIVPPTLNLDNPDEGTEGADLVPKVAKKRKVRAALNNSFGFGGTNASLIVKAVD